MTGPEHYAEAERLLAVVDFSQDAIPEQRTALAAQAQVHATLALAAVTLVASEAGYSTDRVARWEPAIGPRQDPRDGDPWSAPSVGP